ncbi:cytochrome P450 family protein [Mycobacterium paraseoulense]|uniref:Cytochrome n=1 Tax=Mycobacterium paraseoulense TaxID=590652 RepID=A0A1X0I625_9MYCO|nr:cytochrome P450 [Mycobacterium paraseoulense]MCV7397028.1 cytochrome P450 [Mycobacterium paraseoulense]ORB36397.1 cytochrome [Mycobacterium paraseoulense]BBZ69104.1 polyketide biosynthesis cytochrome P450 PksS [Mycobacterium paraseoulense]
MTAERGCLAFTDLTDPIMFSNPYPRYAELRRSAPVSRVRAPLIIGGKGKGYMLTRYEDVLAMHSDPRFSSDVMRHDSVRRVRWLIPKPIRLFTETMVTKDDPEHQRLRRLVHKAFTPKLVAGLADDITLIARELTEQLAQAGEVDLVSDFAVPLPLTVIARLLGVKDDDRKEFHALCLRLTQSSAAGPRGLFGFMTSAAKLTELFERLADERRLDPDDALISQLVRATHDGDKLSDREAIAMIFLLLLAGHDTTSNLIGNSVVALLDHPDQLARLRTEPELIDAGIEELLRFTAPVPVGTVRVALEDVEIGGTRIPKRSRVFGMIISANRDESIFTDADELDLSRTPNKHLAFASGAHYCLGHHLARLEGRIALTQLLQRFDNLEITVPREGLRLKPIPSLRGLESLPMRVS